MSHLTLEALARLVDEPPEPTEASHLDDCNVCRRELAAMKEAVAGLGALPDQVPPPESAWPALEARLRRERLMTGRNGSRPGGAQVWLRLAAGVALFLFGGVSGFVLQSRLRAEVRPSDARIAALPTGAPVAGSPEAQEAARSLAAAENEYLAALERYAAVSAPEAAADPFVRLAALEEIVLATRQALTEAPADPLINGYHLTALAQRQAMLERIVLASDDGWY